MRLSPAGCAISNWLVRISVSLYTLLVCAWRQMLVNTTFTSDMFACHPPHVPLADPLMGMERSPTGLILPSSIRRTPCAAASNLFPSPCRAGAGGRGWVNRFRDRVLLTVALMPIENEIFRCRSQWESSIHVLGDGCQSRSWPVKCCATASTGSSWCARPAPPKWHCPLW